MLTTDQTSRRSGRLRRGAALYLTTVCLSIIVSGIGLTLIATQRADRRLQSNIDLENQAWWIARAGLEIGLGYTEQAANWRSQVTGNTLFSNMSIGNGTCTIQVYDDRDSSLTNDETDPVRLVAIATCNGATCKLQANLLPRPHSVLSYCCFGPTSDDMEFDTNCDIRGPVRSHGRIRRSSNPTVHDDGSFQTMSGYQIDSGLSPASFATTTIASPSVNLSTYLARATSITGTTAGSTCQLKGYNLTPTHNPEGTANANGVYSLDPANRSVVIENMHLKGTLIIYNAPNVSVTFQKALWIEPGPLNYPVLLINNTNASTSISPDQSTLSEVTSGTVLTVGILNLVVGVGVDFNEDGDILDTFPTSVRGIIWAASTQLTLNGGAWTFKGTAINRHIIVDDQVTVDNDVQLQDSLCTGFVGTGMRVVSTNFKDAP